MPLPVLRCLILQEHRFHLILLANKFYFHNGRVYNDRLPRELTLTIKRELGNDFSLKPGRSVAPQKSF